MGLNKYLTPCRIPIVKYWKMTLCFKFWMSITSLAKGYKYDIYISVFVIDGIANVWDNGSYIYKLIRYLWEKPKAAHNHYYLILTLVISSNYSYPALFKRGFNAAINTYRDSHYQAYQLLKF
ncbi:unnamed protein product [Blepharisma stoltei]|uniref:Uncharacterized protein n=1 Tax=Blepharisma stoltei TaxID=1481888 RepID=A0AAU9IMQ6_9CILI|nr:unnamed protein product [Blepharisma stoltei]